MTAIWIRKSTGTGTVTFTSSNLGTGIQTQVVTVTANWQRFTIFFGPHANTGTYPNLVVRMTSGTTGDYFVRKAPAPRKKECVVCRIAYPSDCPHLAHYDNCTPALRRLVRAAGEAPHDYFCSLAEHRRNERRTVPPPCNCWKRAVARFRREREKG